jgi:TPR repeat protein
MEFRAVTMATLLAFGAGAQAVEQEETFTVPEPGAAYIDGRQLSPLTDRSDPRAINNVGWLWARGEGGVKQDYREALNWWKHAARLGYTPSMNNVGLMYANGHGVKRDYEEAFKWWMRSAERGNAWAMNAVGDLYENGYGVPQNYELALNWYREAAREGDGLAMWNIGNLSEQGLGTTQSFAEAARWYRQAAERGSALGMYSLGKVYQAGLVATQPDPAEAYAWYSVAALRFTEEDAVEAEDNRHRLQEAAGQLTAAQRAAADEKVQALDRQLERAKKLRPDGTEAST